RPTVTDVISFANTDAETRRQGDNEILFESLSLSPLPLVSLCIEQEDLLRKAAAVERRSTHPLARAIVLAAEQRGLDSPLATGFQSRGGRGATALVDGQVVAIGNRAMFEDHLVPAELESAMGDLERSGRTAMLVSCDSVIRGVIAVA